VDNIKMNLGEILGRSRHRWVDHIKMNLGEIGGGGLDWSVRIGPAQDCGESSDESLNSRKC
jgi:hypothetical protein